MATREEKLQRLDKLKRLKELRAMKEERQAAPVEEVVVGDVADFEAPAPQTRQQRRQHRRVAPEPVREPTPQELEYERQGQALRTELDRATEANQPLQAILARNKLQEMGYPEREGSIFEAVVEPAMTMASSLPAAIVGGIGGLARGAFPGEEGVSGETARDIEKMFTFVPRTERGQAGLEFLGEQFAPLGRGIETVSRGAGDPVYEALGEEAGAAAYTAPSALIEAIPFLKPIARISRRINARKDAQAQKYRDQGEELMAEAEELRNPTSEESLQNVADALESGDQAEIAAAIEPDTAFYQAADDLGINTEPLASFASENPQFREIEMGLSSIPGSQLNAQSKQFIAETAQKADDLIENYGGTLDKADLSIRFRDESMRIIDDLGDEADALYDSLGKNIPATTRVDAVNTVTFLRQKAEELGGIKELPPLLRRVLRKLESKSKTKATKRIDVTTGKPIPGVTTTTKPTHGSLDQTRKEVGQSVYKGTGPFKDAETGLMKQLYKRLKQDQDAVAEIMEMSDVSATANGLVRQRKQLEDNLNRLLGKDLVRDIVPAVGASLKKLSKGEVQQWDRVMRTIPKGMRQEIVVTTLNEIFRGNNVGGQALNVTQFTKIMQELDRQPTLKDRLYKELPPGAIKPLNDLKIISAGISRALGDKINTGRISALFDSENGMVRRLMGRGIATTAGAMTKSPMVASAVNELLNQKTSGAVAASSMLSSPKFQQMIQEAVRDGFTEGAAITDRVRKAEDAFAKSKTYTKWKEVLDPSEQQQLAQVGLVSYLLEIPREVTEEKEPRRRGGVR